MNVKLTSVAILAGLALASWTTTAMADSADAECVVHERGEKKQNQSGPCLFSQRQGYVDIRLANGKEYNLSPQDKPDVFKDQKGQRVKRDASGNEHQYKWEHKNIKVRFNGGGGGSSHGSSQGHSSDPTTSTQYVTMDSSGGGNEYSDSLTPGSSKRYVLNARNRQNLYVRVAPRGDGVYYQIFNPDNSFLLDQMTPNREYRGELWQNGEHVIEVMNRGRDTVSYNVIIGLD
jgi:hypothetical protein